MIKILAVILAALLSVVLVAACSSSSSTVPPKPKPTVHVSPTRPSTSTPAPVPPPAPTTQAPSPQPSFVTEPPGLVPNNGLDDGCSLTPTGVVLQFWNPTDSSILIHQVAVSLFSQSGVESFSGAVNTPAVPTTIGPASLLTIPVAMPQVNSTTTACVAGWT